ncbi:MAG: sensor domain-containing diguanylate cyclase [Chloroflexi bacterium]|nr:sensor domain-containing diguanylate cyclase [Chloroflexota bacterium]
MTQLDQLGELSTLITDSLPPEVAIRKSLPLLREGIGASDVYLIYGWEDGFRCIGTAAKENLSDVGLWLINQDLSARHQPCVFDLTDGKVENFHGADSGQPTAFVAAMVPVQITSDMLIARGNWDDGLKPEQLSFLQVVLPALALLMERWLEGKRAERQQKQLSALASIPRVMSESDNLETVLTGIARTIASVSSVNYVSIDVLGPNGEIAFRSVNGPDRPGTDALTDKWKQAAQRPDPIRDEVIKTGSPQLFPDAQNDERLPEGSRSYFSRTLIRSTALFPLLDRGEVLGTIGVASHKPLEFDDQDIELLEALASQVAGAVKGIQLYQVLAESREELRRVNQQLRETMGIEYHLARTDPLTGIPNRRFVDETLESEYLRASRYGQELSVVLADMDNLKDVNDQHSHEAGDEVLQVIANRARESCRGVDVAGRYGGDEFLFILPSTKLEDASALAERFRKTVTKHPVVLATGKKVELSVSIGVAQWRNSMAGPADLLREADRALYRAKTAGHNRTMLATDDGDVRAA